MSGGLLIGFVPVWTVILGFGVFLYVLLDGFDLGVGILYGFAPDAASRNLVMNAIAPIWDGNEVWLIVAGSIFGFTAYIWLLHHVRPALATSYAYVNPPIAVLFGAVLGGETFSATDLGAMAVILLGVVIITLSRSRAPRPVPTQEPPA